MNSQDTTRTDLRFLRTLFVMLAVSITGFQLWIAYFGGSLTPLVVRSTHVALVLAALFVVFDWRGGNRLDPAYGGGLLSACIDLALAAITAGTSFYAAYNADRFLMSVSSFPMEATALDLTLAGILLVMILEASRRSASAAFAVIAVVVLGYALLGDHAPSILAINAFTVREVLVQFYTSTVGFWGEITGVSAVEIAVLILFAGLLTRLGGLDFMRNASVAIAGRATGGAGKVAVVMSALFGMISGSSAANIASVGGFTIPMMMRQGYRPGFAAAVEAGGSTFGQLMPPLMGTGAFIMAELLGVSYSHIMVSAIVPALVIYAAIFFAIHFYSAKHSVGALPESTLREARERLTLASGLQFLVPLLVLAGLLIAGRSIPTSAFFAYVCAVCTFVALNARSPLREILLRLREAIIAGCLGLLSVGTLIISAQVVVALINMTSLGVTMTSIAAGGFSSPLALALISAGAAIVLGMGLPTTAAYVVAASVTVPLLQSTGVAPLAAHMFIFFFAVLSAITPPVCVAVYVGAAIAGANWLEVARECMRISLMKYVLPFVMLYNGAILLDGTWSAILLSVAAAMALALVLEALCFGYMHTRFSRLDFLLGSASAALFLVYLINPSAEALSVSSAAAVGGALCLAAVWVLNHRRRPAQIPTTLETNMLENPNGQ